MFDLESFEFDFDENFSTNIFTKCFKNANDKQESEPRDSKRTEGMKRQPSFRNNYDAPNKKLKNDHLNTVFNFSSITSCTQSIQTDNSPQKNGQSHEGLPQRKFPGPAGLLPDKETGDLSFLVDTFCCKEDKEDKVKLVRYSQSSGSVFLKSTYQALVSDFNLNQPDNPLHKYTVEWVKKIATSKALQGRRIPFLAVVLHCINNRTPDPVLVLRDPTGEINGTLHREVWLDMAGKLRTGITLALRQVGVLITGVIRRQIYLNITLNNILAVYSPTETDLDVGIIAVNEPSKVDLMKSIEGWRTSHPSPKTSTDSQGNREQTKNLRNKLELLVRSNASGNAFTGSDATAPWSTSTPEPGKGKPGIDSHTEDGGAAGDRRSRSPGKPRATVFEGGPARSFSQPDSFIFEQVLSGISLDEFET